jgi:hypothetical protein
MALAVLGEFASWKSRLDDIFETFDKGIDSQANIIETFTKRLDSRGDIIETFVKRLDSQKRRSYSGYRL